MPKSFSSEPLRRVPEGLGLITQGRDGVHRWDKGEADGATRSKLGQDGQVRADDHRWDGIATDGLVVGLKDDRGP